MNIAVVCFVGWIMMNTIWLLCLNLRIYQDFAWTVGFGLLSMVSLHEEPYYYHVVLVEWGTLMFNTMLLLLLVCCCCCQAMLLKPCCCLELAHENPYDLLVMLIKPCLLNPCCCMLLHETFIRPCSCFKKNLLFINPSISSKNHVHVHICWPLFLLVIPWYISLPW